DLMHEQRRSRPGPRSDESATQAWQSGWTRAEAAAIHHDGIFRCDPIAKRQWECDISARTTHHAEYSKRSRRLANIWVVHWASFVARAGFRWPAASGWPRVRA